VGCNKIILVSFKRIRYFNTQIIAGLNIIKIMKRLVNPNTNFVKTGAAVVRNKLDRIKLINFSETSGMFAG
jgi:hypothetical protein